MFQGVGWGAGEQHNRAQSLKASFQPWVARPPAGAHTLVGGFSSALEPGTPFSVLSLPEELTRHSFL